LTEEEQEEEEEERTAEVEEEEERTKERRKDTHVTVSNVHVFVSYTSPSYHIRLTLK
jgi:hypothetical protein